VFSGPDPRNATYFVNYETIAGGMGARPNRAGIDAVRVHASGAANLPVEALEHSYPIRLERYAIRDDSGGVGQNRGGHGVIRDYRAMADGMRISLSAERQHVPAPGVAGGGGGAVGEFILDPGKNTERRLGAAMSDVDLPRGSIISIRTPGGGAFGKAVT
jgi:N-methylhydantoinase B